MTQAPEPLTVVVGSRLEDLRILHGALDRYCRDRGLPQQPVGQLQLALEEHVTNIIRHSGQTEGSPLVRVQAQILGGNLVVEVRDHGQPFNPLELPPPDLQQPIEERPLGGLGIHMMRQLTDRLEYRREGATNVLTLVKCCESPRSR